eukprot:8280504-Pyramimonas_sp.AAC.1
MEPKMWRMTPSEGGGMLSMLKCRTKRGVSSCRPPPGGAHAATIVVSATYTAEPPSQLSEPNLRAQRLQEILDRIVCPNLNFPVNGIGIGRKSNDISKF